MAPASTLPFPATAVERADAFAAEPARLAVLLRTGLLDAGVQESLQRYARLASALTETPAAVVSLVDAERQYFSARVGVDSDGTALDASYCKHAIADDVQLCIGDAAQDSVLRSNPATTRDGVRAYLGSPVAAGDQRLGTLCVFDYAPRSWDVRHRRVITDLAAAVSSDIALRLAAADSADLASHDPLTGLGNRLAFDRAISVALSERRQVALGMFDLDGFKDFNDTYGHPAGDTFLRRAAQRLVCAVGDGGQAFRLGGDEFCVLAADRTVLRNAQVALSATFGGQTVTASLGEVLLPAEAQEPDAAVSLADERLYTAKRSRPGAVGQQVAAVLACMLHARADTGAGDHADLVARLAIQVATHLGLDPATVRDVGVAAQLHDIGKVAIPDAVLSRRGALGDEDWALVRTHTVIGQSIVSAAPALHGIGELIRSTHERPDGRGYPDGLIGEEIPLGARIIGACEAYGAMLTDRPHAAARTRPEAVLELRRCAGTQFDERVVAALVALVG